VILKSRILSRTSDTTETRNTCVIQVILLACFTYIDIFSFIKSLLTYWQVHQNEHMRWWYIHKIQNQCIGFFLKPSILIMKRWQVLNMHNFFILINRVLYIFFHELLFWFDYFNIQIKVNMHFIVSCLFNLGWILIELMVWYDLDILWQG
jgi:hypothetical protein